MNRLTETVVVSFSLAIIFGLPLKSTAQEEVRERKAALAAVEFALQNRSLQDEFIISAPTISLSRWLTNSTPAASLSDDARLSCAEEDVRLDCLLDERGPSAGVELLTLRMESDSIATVRVHVKEFRAEQAERFREDAADRGLPPRGTGWYFVTWTIRLEASEDGWSVHAVIDTTVS